MRMQLIFLALRRSRSLASRTLLAVWTIGMLCCWLLLAASPAWANSLIRDEEIEHTLRAYAAPIFKEAGLDPAAVRIFIVQDDTINAFVMGGSNIFINTGLIMMCTSPDMLIGAMAHETGHIAGGHLVQTSQEIERAKMKAIIGGLLGAAAMAGGASDVGAAVISASQQSAMRGLFSYTRSNEQAADQAAIKYMDALGISSEGMLQLFEVLRKLENRKLGRPDPYTRTHPLSADRIMNIRAHASTSAIPAHAVPAEYPRMHARMLAKLKGFLGDPNTVLNELPITDLSESARIARTVAWYRQPNLARALQEVNSLLAEFPTDPFYHELKGQILFEHGHIADAEASYAEASRLMPDAPLIRTELARTQIAQETPALLPQALMNLEYATTADPKNPSAWRLLATAYGKQNQMDLSHLALAEEALLLNKPDLANQQLDYAEHYLKLATPAYLRAQDLRAEAKMLEKDLKKQKNNGNEP